MKLPVSWLAEFTDLPDLGELAQRLTAAGLECAVSQPPVFPERVVTGRIVSCEPHPNADRLSVCRVDVGEKKPYEIVCGAPNAATGHVGVAALPGADLGGGFVIRERKLRGVTSRGMLCSKAELGLAEDSEGILLLPADTPIGRPAAEVLAREPVLETEPTPNRGDWMSVVGVAREIATVSRRPLRSPSGGDAPDAPAGGWSVRIADANDCPRYAGRVLEGLTYAPSPGWLADRLVAAGVRPIANLVDVTNYVRLERGHPLHAFDLAKLTGQEIGVRRSTKGEKLVTLDGKDRELQQGTLVITDGSGPVAVAGIMGGAPTMVSESSQRVFLEGASFDAACVRSGARRVKLTTDASARFERGVDPEGVPGALDRCVELLLQLCPDARLVHAVDEYPAPVARREITLRRRTLRRLLGVEVDAEEVREILDRLGIEVTDETDEAWSVRAPTYRPDVAIEEDLVEEVGRVHGYDRIPARNRTHAAANVVDAPRLEVIVRTRHVLLGLGLTEVVTPSLVDGEAERRVVDGGPFFGPPVPLRNPLTSDRDCLRGSIVPSLLQVLVTNCARSTRDLAIFETSRAFAGSAEAGVTEAQRIAILLSGTGLAHRETIGAKPSDFFDMKGLLEVYVEQFWGEKLRLRNTGPSPLDPARSAEVLVRDRAVGFLGELDREVRVALDLPTDFPVLLAELDVESGSSRVKQGTEFEALPRFPGVVRDLAFVVPVARRHAEVEAALSAEGGELLASVRLFDVYAGAPLAAGERSLAYTLTFRSPERSLTNEEVDRQVERIISRLAKELGARIR